MHDSFNNTQEDSQFNDSKLNESNASSVRGGRRKKTLKDYEFVIIENSKYKTSELGKGAYGTVKKVKDLENGKIFAMKIMNKKAIFEYSNKENLKREISIQRKIHHPHIIRLYTCFEDSENVYLVLEFAENGSLFNYLRKKKTLREDEAFIFFFQTCLGIHYLHRKNVVHRDLKPENLLLDGEGNIKLCDFGWSADTYSKRVTFCGTVDYLAPEMVKNLPHDHRIDIWCLGILLYEMLHGKAPFQGRTDAEKTKNISMNNPIYYDPSLSPEIVNLIQRILKHRPVDRITMMEIFNHPWMKRHEKKFGIDIMSYIEDKGSEKQEATPSQNLNDSFGASNTKQSAGSTSASGNAKIITIQDTTPLNLPNSSLSLDEKKARSEPTRDFEKKNEKSQSEANSVNIEQFLKDYKIDGTPEMSLLNKVEKFSANKENSEPERSQPFKAEQRSISMPTNSVNQDKPQNNEYNPYAHQEGETLEQFLDRIRSLNRGGTQSENPFASGNYGRTTTEENIRTCESPRFSQNVQGSASLYKAETASFGKRSTLPENLQTFQDEDEDLEPQRLSRLSKRNIEIGHRRTDTKSQKELNFVEKILVRMGCMARDNTKPLEN